MQKNAAARKRLVAACRRSFATIATLSLYLVGCSGGGSGTSVPVAPIAAPLTPVLPAQAAFAATSSVTPAAAAGATTLTLPLPGNALYSGTATFPVTSVPPNLDLTLTYTNVVPAGLTPFATTRGEPSAQVRRPQDEYSTDTVYACFAANYIVTLNGAPQFTFVMPPGMDPIGIVYYMALWDDSQWLSGYGGPGTITASTTATTLTIVGLFPFTITPSNEVCVAVYGRWATAPAPVPATPLPVATPSPTPAPSGPTTAPTLSPTALTFTSLGVTQSLTATQTAYTGALTETNTCSGIATITPAAGTGPSATFSVTSVAAGSCTVTVKNSAGLSATATVGVTTLGVVITAKPGQP